MDPNAAFAQLLAELPRCGRDPTDHAYEIATDLVSWLRRGGFWPQGVARHEVTAALRQVLGEGV